MEDVRRHTNRFKTIRDKIIKIKAAITFLIRCRNVGIVPKFIKNSIKNIFNLFHVNGQQSFQKTIQKFTEELQNRILNLNIRQKHELLKQFNKELNMQNNILNRILTEEEMYNFLKFEDKVAANFNRKIKEKHKRKFECLVNLKKEEFNFRFNKKFFVNKTNTHIPIDTQYILSLGHKHSLPIKKEQFPTLKIITDGEELVQTLKSKEEQEIARTKLTTIIDNHINKMKLTNRDKFLLKKVKDLREIRRFWIHLFARR